VRAVTFDSFGGPLRVVDVPRPDCALDGVVIDVRATGVCRSDWHAWRGHDPVSLPHVPGHELAGVVAEAGPRVSGVTVGDRVTVPFVVGCSRCEWCRSGHAQVCPDQTQPGFTQAGSFAEQVAIGAADFNVVQLPDELDFVTAAMLGCRFATAYHALTEQAQVQPGEWVAVYGCGGVGLSAVMVATALGARVVAVDPSPAALARASDLGAEAVVGGPDPVPAVRSVTAGGAHCAMDAFGSRATAGGAVRSLRRRGRHVQVGLLFGDDRRTPLPWDLVVAQELRILGAHGMAAGDYPPMLDLIASGRLQPRRLVGSVIPLDQAGAALMAMDQPMPARVGFTVATV
jgi:alcohol dehydrogenase